MDARAEWAIIDSATTEIGLLLGHDSASEAIRDYLWRAKDPESRKLDPMPNFVVAQVPDAAELERMLVGVAEASAGTPEERGAVVALIRAAFKR